MLPVASLAGSAVGKCLGMEASGIVTAVGSGVTSFKVGDHVVTMEPHSFASFQNVPASRVYAMPESMAFDVGSTTLGVYNTVHHALINLARVRKGKPTDTHVSSIRDVLCDA
jgi:NADPH:quinone reductase-like Zn-dependent oxidoreductase